MIITKNLNGEQTATLENATQIGYERVTNDLWYAHFTMPEKDPKNKHIKMLQFVEVYDDLKDEYIGLFKVMPKLTKIDRNNETITYTCEHVISLLIGATLFQYHQLSNYTTKAVLEYLIDQQHTKHWKLGEVDFTRYFHYSWENENLLSAIFSVPQAFDEQYRWTWDTTNYPFTLNLKRVSNVPSAKIEEGYNLEGIQIEENPNSLWNRIYPLGSGEGVNQLTIKEVNNGVPYVEDAQSIQRNGLYERTWVDRRFEDAEHMKAVAERTLEIWSEPVVSWNVEAIDLSSITGLKLDELVEGKIVRLSLDDYGDVDLRIVSEKKSDIYNRPQDIKLQLENLSEDITSDIAGIQRKQQINELYSQGATNIMNYTFQDNCDNNQPARIPIYIDNDVVNINTIELTFRTRRFRAYSGITEGGGSLVKSTSSGGSTTRSTTSGGSVSKSTASGGSTTRTSSSAGESTRTSSAGGSHRHRLAVYNGPTHPNRGLPDAEYVFGGASSIQMLQAKGTSGDLYTYTASHDHTHTVTTPAHTHSVSIPSHTHGFEIPNHSHDVTIPNHSHDIEIPDHTHDIKHEIVEAPVSASSVIITVDGNSVPHTATSGDRINLVDYMSKNIDGTISRGRHEILITPDTLARIEADVILRVFIRSQIGGVL